MSESSGFQRWSGISATALILIFLFRMFTRFLRVGSRAGRFSHSGRAHLAKDLLRPAGRHQAQLCQTASGMPATCGALPGSAIATSALSIGRISWVIVRGFFSDWLTVKASLGAKKTQLPVFCGSLGREKSSWPALASTPTMWTIARAGPLPGQN